MGMMTTALAAKNLNESSNYSGGGAGGGVGIIIAIVGFMALMTVTTFSIPVGLILTIGGMVIGGIVLGGIVLLVILMLGSTVWDYISERRSR